MKQITPLLFLALLLTASCHKDENGPILQPGYTITLKYSIDLVQLDAGKPIQAATDTTDNYIGIVGFYQRTSKDSPKFEHKRTYITNDSTKGSYSLTAITTLDEDQCKIISNKDGVLTLSTKSLTNTEFISSETDTNYFMYYGHPSNELTIVFKYNDKGITLPDSLVMAALNKLLENMNNKRKYGIT